MTLSKSDLKICFNSIEKEIRIWKYKDRQDKVYLLRETQMKLYYEMKKIC